VYVPRTLLWDRLDAATSNALTLLVGPMGSGKSLGVSGWLESRGTEDVRWIAADAGWGPPRVQDALLAAQQPGEAAPRLVVIDDSHLLPLASVRLVDDRLNDAPDSLRVLLVSRWDLPITRLGAELRGHFTVLRGELLRLDERDSATLVAEHARTDAVEVARAVTEHTQGWCAAVVLTARSLAATRDPLVAARRLRYQESPVADAVAAEVFASLPPQDRHLLLCVANEEIVSVDTARHLTGDPDAAATLAELETTGLMVTRVGDEADVRDPTTPDGVARYRIHPLLAEVVRRRIAAGGEDVERARSAVLGAVRLDAARGDSSRSFRRLLGLNHPQAAAQVLAADAPELIAHDGGAAVRTFVRQHRVVVEDHPDAWFAVCAERWFDDDVPQALHWMDKLLQQPPERRALLVGEIACVQLMRARLGLEPLEESVASAELVLRDHAGSLSLAVLLQLRVELGIVQTWLGHLDAAQANLAEAVRVGRSSVLPAYAASALSHLAFTMHAQGRERASARLATDALEEMANVPGWRPPMAIARAELAVQLAGLSGLPWPAVPQVVPPSSRLVHSADHTVKFWLHLREARLALAAGSVVSCLRILQTQADVPRLPRHLQLVVVIERAFVLALTGDERALMAQISQLDGLGAPAERALLQGLHADLRGDLRGAVDHFARAARGRPIAQPDCRALALVGQAQLLEELGERDRALDALREAVTITEVSGNAAPFLGWSRHGTPVHRLLARLAEQAPDGWLHELAQATKGRPNITEVLGPWTPTVHEQGTVAEPMTSRGLSPRERDVLHELARGATYADMAANLYLSENTIKTHVSALYAKLAVNRRSEALAVARKLDLF
jgi:LuxR family transcriptional regulator, maltose regulon positive regulatory protein